MRTARDTQLRIWLALVCACWASAASAATSLSNLRYAPDITVLLNGKRVGPQQIAIDDLAGNVNILDVGSYPAGARIAAYHELTNGDKLLAFDTTVNLVGGLTARPGDVVRYNGATYSLFFDAAANGVPDGAVVDAIALGSNGELLMSFDTTVKLDALTVDDEDLVRFENDAFSLAFDGSAAGIAADLDLDGAYYVQSNGHLLLSFDGSGKVGNPAVSFEDEDVLEYDPTAQTWELIYDGSAEAPGWPPGDLTGLFAYPIIPTSTPTSTSMPTMPANTPTQTNTVGPSAVPTETATNTPTSQGATATSTSGQSPAATHTQTHTPVLTSPTSTATATTPGPTASSTATATAGTTPTGGATCAGDCDGNGTVTINELILLVNIALGSEPLSSCPAGDINHNGEIAVNEIITAVNNALGTCG